MANSLFKRAISAYVGKHSFMLSVTRGQEETWEKSARRFQVLRLRLGWNWFSYNSTPIKRPPSFSIKHSFLFMYTAGYDTWIGPIPWRSSFNLLGVIASGNEPMTTRFDGLPLLDALVTTTRLALESGVDPDALVLLSEGPTTIRCWMKQSHSLWLSATSHKLLIFTSCYLYVGTEPKS